MHVVTRSAFAIKENLYAGTPMYKCLLLGTFSCLAGIALACIAGLVGTAFLLYGYRSRDHLYSPQSRFYEAETRPRVQKFEKRLRQRRLQVERTSRKSKKPKPSPLDRNALDGILWNARDAEAQYGGPKSGFVGSTEVADGGWYVHAVSARCAGAHPHLKSCLFEGLWYDREAEAFILDAPPGQPLLFQSRRQISGRLQSSMYASFPLLDLNSAVGICARGD
jgi:hypothetical protein